MQTGVALGLGVGKTPAKPAGGIPAAAITVRSGDVLVDRSGQVITYR